MGVNTLLQANCSGSDFCPQSSWSYGGAGRQKSETGEIDAQQVLGSATRCYDAENHIIGTNTGACSPPGAGVVYAWGPEGHPLTIGTFDSNGHLQNETLHWNGNSLLFATGQQSNAPILDDIKIGTEGDILPRDPSVPGLVFFDRGPAGVVMGCHNADGATFGGFGDVFGQGWAGEHDTQPCYSATVAMPTSIDWYGTNLIYGTNLGLPIGQGGALGMPRTDGLTDNYDTLQGVRSYSSTAGSWTTPDAYPGVVTNPTSQKPYIWNGNNPVSYADPSGYDRLMLGFYPALTMGTIVLAWHVYAVLENNHGQVLRVYSYGPSNENNPLTSFLNKDFGLGTSFAQLWGGAKGLVYVPKSYCEATCAWEPRWNRYFDQWPDNTIRYFSLFNTNTLVAASQVSGSPISEDLKYSGLPTSLPPGSMSPVGGWGQPSGWSGPNDSGGSTSNTSGTDSATSTTSQPTSSTTDTDPDLGLSNQFVQNAWQAEDFMEQGQQFAF